MSGGFELWLPVGAARQLGKLYTAHLKDLSVGRLLGRRPQGQLAEAERGPGQPRPDPPPLLLMVSARLWIALAARPPPLRRPLKQVAPGPGRPSRAGQLPPVEEGSRTRDGLRASLPVLRRWRLCGSRTARGGAVAAACRRPSLP